jgi:hypothetical protein
MTCGRVVYYHEMNALKEFENNFEKNKVKMLIKLYWKHFYYFPSSLYKQPLVIDTASILTSLSSNLGGRCKLSSEGYRRGS